MRDSSDSAFHSAPHFLVFFGLDATFVLASHPVKRIWGLKRLTGFELTYPSGPKKKKDLPHLEPWSSSWYDTSSDKLCKHLLRKILTSLNFSMTFILTPCRVPMWQKAVMEEAQRIDLTYITERIITILCPPECSDERYLQNLQEIIVMLQSKHGHNYMVRRNRQCWKKYQVLMIQKWPFHNNIYHVYGL